MPVSVVKAFVVTVTVSITVVVSWAVSVTVWITVVVGSVMIPPGSLIECRLELAGASEGLAKNVLPRIRSRKGPSTVCVSIYLVVGFEADDPVNLPFRRYDLDTSSLRHTVTDTFHRPLGDAGLG